MTVLVADNIADVRIEALRSAEYSVIARSQLSKSAPAKAFRAEQRDVLIVRSTGVTAEALEASAGLALIVRAGAGYDPIDVEGAAERGIFVVTCPGRNSVAVAELTLGLIPLRGASDTQQALDATALGVARVARTFDEMRDVPNCVHLAPPTEASYHLTVRHRDKAGVLAGALAEVRRVNWNILEMSTRTF